MKPLFRFAALKDLPALTEMLRHYLYEQERGGSPVRLTHRTLEAYRHLMRSYLGGGSFGVVVMVEVDGSPAGFALAGENAGGLAFDTTLGKIAFIWIAWVEPPHRKLGLALGMLSYGRPRLVELGFETASMCVREDNPEGQALTLAFGAQPSEREYLFRLRELPAHLKENPRGKRR